MAKLTGGSRVTIDDPNASNYKQNGIIDFSYPNGNVHVQLDNGNGWSGPMADLVPEALPSAKFKIGDRVMIHRPGSTTNGMIGEILSFSGFSGGPYVYYFKQDNTNFSDLLKECELIAVNSGPGVVPLPNAAAGQYFTINRDKSSAPYPSEYYMTINKSPVKELTQPKTCSCLSWDLFQHGCRCGAFDGGDG